MNDTICPHCHQRFKPSDLVGNALQKMLPQHCPPIRAHWDADVMSINCPGSFQEIRKDMHPRSVDEFLLDACRETFSVLWTA